MQTLSEALASHKRLGVVLSAGYFGFFGHAGLLAALEGAGIDVAAMSGSSAGALIGAMWAGGLSAEEMGRMLAAVRRADFWDPIRLSDLLWRRDLPATGLLRGERFYRKLRELLPATEFEACRRPVFIEAANLTTGESEVLRSGDLALAVRASCALPGLFLPVRVGDALYWDGGMLNKVPVTCLMDRVDAVLIHWLPSSELVSPLKLGLGLRRHLGTLVRGFAMARRESSRLQARLAVARGVPVYVLRPTLPRLGPTRLHLGPQALEAARSLTLDALAAPAEQALLDAEAKVLM